MAKREKEKRKSRKKEEKQKKEWDVLTFIFINEEDLPDSYNDIGFLAMTPSPPSFMTNSRNAVSSSGTEQSFRNASIWIPSTFILSSKSYFYFSFFNKGYQKRRASFDVANKCGVAGLEGFVPLVWRGIVEYNHSKQNNIYKQNNNN